MALVVGLDLGSKTVSGAVFSGKAGNFRLVDYFVEEIPSIESYSAQEGDEDGADLDTPLSLADFLDRLIKERNLEQADFVAGFDTRNCVVREFPVPFLKDEQIARTVNFEAEGQFPGLDLEDVNLEYYKVGETGNKSQLVVWALDKEKIAARLDMLQSIKIDPIALDIDAAALFNAYALTPTFDVSKTMLIVDMGATSTKFILVEEGKLRKVRALRLDTMVHAPDRMIPEPAVVGDLTAEDAATNGSRQSEVSIEVVGKADAESIFDNSSIESRFREIEDALQRLDPAVEGDDLEDAPIAILTDGDYDLVRETGDAAIGEIDSSLALATSAGPSKSSESFESSEKGETLLLDDLDAAPDADESDAENSEESFSRLPPRDDDVPFDYDAHLERIALEIQRSLVGLRLSSPVELICITGGVARPEAVRYFSEELDVETIALDFGDSFPSDLGGEQHREVGRSGAVAVGLAVKALGADQLGIDFRKGPFRYEHKFEKVRLPLMVAAVLFFLFSLQAVFWSIQEWKQAKNRVVHYELYTQESYKKFFGRPISEGASAFRAASKKKEAWRGRGGGRGARYIDVSEAVTNTAELISKTGMFFEISSLDLNLRAALPGGKKKSNKGKPVLPKAPTKSTVTLETNSAGMPKRLRDLFNKGTQSKVFNVKVIEPKSRGEMTKLTLELTVKKSKLKELSK